MDDSSDVREMYTEYLSYRGFIVLTARDGPQAIELARAARPDAIVMDLDFRRTAIRNLERAGVPRSAAMKMVGHKTESVYRRYAIVDEATMRESGVSSRASTTSRAPQGGPGACPAWWCRASQP